MRLIYDYKVHEHLFYSIIVRNKDWTDTQSFELAMFLLYIAVNILLNKFGFTSL